ncbi:MAG: hypothetical protein LAT83_13245 [Kiritimatiellae bacterium]|nr:hypothetical protein [Kiritimatiellia bacterium]
MNEAEAKRAGCDLVNLKPGTVNAVQKWFSANTMHLAIYDPKETGQLALAHTIEIPSWYAGATIEYISYQYHHDLMAIRFEGNRGTGILQYLYMILMWRNESFEIVFLDTVSYTIELSGQDLTTHIDFENLGLGSIELSTHYTLQANTGTFTGEWDRKTMSLKSQWSDTLHLENSGTFYDPEYETYWLNKPGVPEVRRQLSRARLHFLKDRPKLDSLTEYLKQHKSIFYGIL